MPSFKEGDRIKNYKAQIVKYCDVHNIEIPNEFHLNDTHKLVVVIGSKILHPKSYYIPGDLIHDLRKNENGDWYVLNFKDCYKYIYDGTKKLKRLEKFEGYVQYASFNN